jgi:hypothetical protein
MGVKMRRKMSSHLMKKSVIGYSLLVDLVYLVYLVYLVAITDNE